MLNLPFILPLKLNLYPCPAAAVIKFLIEKNGSGFIVRNLRNLE
jgi:hypothetical protein